MSTYTTQSKRHCQICGTTHAGMLRSGAIVRPAIANLIQRETGTWDAAG